MLNIENRLFVSVKIDGQDIGDMVGGFNSVLLCEGNSMRVPTFLLALSDRASTFTSRRAFTDGNEVEILVGKAIDDRSPTVRKYRIFKPGGDNSADGPALRLVGIINAPKYIIESVSEAYRGSSEQALRQLAAKCGLKFSGPSEFNGRTTNDSQVWLHSMVNRSTSMLDIVQHSWMDANSGMAVAITSKGEMRFRNVIDVINTPVDKIKYVLLHNAMSSDIDSGRKTYIVRSSEEHSRAGASNARVNYGATHAESTLDGTHAVTNKLDVKTRGGFLPINSKVKDMVNMSRHTYAELDCGNTHEHYQEAIYQNERLLALFSERESVLVYDVTEFDLYDPVIYRQADADIASPVKASDIYIVVGKTVCITAAAQYAERIELARMSLTMKGTSDLVGPGSFESEKSLIPDVFIPNGAVASSAIKASAKSAGILSGVLTPLTDLLSLVSAARNSAAANLNGLVGQLPEIQNTVLHGTSAQVSAVFTELTGTVGVCTTSVKAQNAMAARSETAIMNLGRTLPASYGVAARQQALLSEGSASDLMTAQMINKMPYDRAVGFIKKAAQSLPPKMRKLAPVGQAEKAVAEYMGVTEQGNRHLSNQWNTTVSSINGVPAPERTIPTSGVSNCFNSITSESCRESTTDKELCDEMRAGILSSSGSPTSWASIDAFPDVDKSVGMAQSAALLKGSVRRIS